MKLENEELVAGLLDEDLHSSFLRSLPGGLTVLRTDGGRIEDVVDSRIGSIRWPLENRSARVYAMVETREDT